MRHVALLLTLIIFAANSNAQNNSLKETDLTGLWKGELYNDTNKLTYKYEIGISKTKGKLHGFSHTWFILDDKQYYGVKKVKIRIKDNKLIIEDDELISNNYPVAPAKGVRQLNVLDLIADSSMRLSGPFSTNRTKEYRSLTGSINLERKNDHWQSALVPHLQELQLTDELSFLEDDVVLKANQQDFAKLEIKRKQTIPVSEIESRGILPASNVGLAAKPGPEKETKTKPLNNNTTGAVSMLPPAGDQSRTAAVIRGNRENQKDPRSSAVDQPGKQNSDIVKAEVNPARPVTKTDIVKKQANTAAISKDDKPQKTTTAGEEIKSSAAPEAKAQINTEVRNESKVNAEPVVTPSPVINSNVSPPKFTGAATDLSFRKTMVQQVVNFKSDSLMITLYDNGEVDGDTVSVLLNGNVIMPRQGLSTNAVRKTIYIDPSTDSIQLIMYAENLGSIAPNTGLLVVRDGKDLYEIRFSGDFQKNAAIIFRRKKK